MEARGLSPRAFIGIESIESRASYLAAKVNLSGRIFGLSIPSSALVKKVCGSMRAGLSVLQGYCR
jgi:hypothetical protein